MFCTKINFDLGDENMSRKYIGDPGRNDEDKDKEINAFMQDLINKYRRLFENVKDMLKCTPHDLARAVYFTTYYHPDNTNYQSYLFDRELSSEGMKDFDNFYQMKHKEEDDDHNFEYIKEKLQDFTNYKRMLRRGL